MPEAKPRSVRLHVHGVKYMVSSTWCQVHGVKLTSLTRRVARDSLWKIMLKLDCPDKFNSMVRQFQESIQDHVWNDGSASAQLLSLSKQRRARGPTIVFRGDDGGIYRIYINFRTGGRPFNFRSKVNRSVLILNYSPNPANYFYIFLLPIPDSFSLPLSSHLLLLQPFYVLVPTRWLTTHSHTRPERNRQQLKVYKIYLLYIVDTRRRHCQ